MEPERVLCVLKVLQRAKTRSVFHTRVQVRVDQRSVVKREQSVQERLVRVLAHFPLPQPSERSAFSAPSQNAF